MTCDSKIIYSPGVGRFWPSSNCSDADGGIRIGYLIRLNEKLPIVIPSFHGHLEYLAVSGAFVHTGTPIAQLSNVDNTSVPSNHDGTNLSIVSPADGFLTCTDETGIPLKKNGEILKPGEIIAILEFMKIRMDILYDGPNDAMFDHYEGDLHRSVKKGECIGVLMRNA
ncbi:MAG: hypothetical protein J6A01_12350 [Proteobacteria bacterium]|nr:hypothetical protein [Pseudomonadota bacterium]